MRPTASVTSPSAFVLLIFCVIIVSCSQARDEAHDASKRVSNNSSKSRSTTPANIQAGSASAARPSYVVSRSFSTGEDSSVRSLRADGGALWVGTSEGVIQVARDTGEMGRTYTIKDGLMSPYIF